MWGHWIRQEMGITMVCQIGGGLEESRRKGRETTRVDMQEEDSGERSTAYKWNWFIFSLERKGEILTTRHSTVEPVTIQV